MSTDLCETVPASGLIPNLLMTTDCQASSLVERGYATLSAPGAATAAMLTSLMVIAVALYGYRLLLGRGLVLGEVVRLAIRLGVALTLAASWSSFQTVAFDAVARQPSRVASDLIVAIAAPPPLVGVQSALDQIEQVSIGWRTRAGIASPLVGGAPTAAMTLNVSSFLLTISTLGVLVVSHILLSLLVAVVPLVAGFLLFDATRGLLEGWLRALVTAAVTPLFVLILASIELAILSPLLARVVDQQASGQFEVDDVTPVGLVVLVFSLAILASVRAAATIAGGIRLARDFHPADPPRDAQPPSSTVSDQPLLITASPTVTAPVLRALEAATRRDGNAAAMQFNVAALGSPRGRDLGERNAGRSVGGDMLLPPTHNSFLAPGRARLVRASRAAARRDS